MQVVTPLACVVACVAGLARAEGAARVLACRSLHDCDAAGFCEEAAGAVGFRLEPRDVGADGSGSFSLDAGAGPVPARGMGDAGPWVWTEAGGGSDTLLLSDASHALWHHRGADGAVRVRFLICEVTQ